MTDEPMFTSEKELRFRQFNELGEERVRQLLSEGKYGGRRLAYAQEWIGRFDSVRQAAKEASANDLASRAALAAERQALSAEMANAIAKRANTIAAMAMITAVIAIAVSIVTAVLS